MELLQRADHAKTLRRIASGEIGAFRFGLSECLASATRLRYFAEKCSKHLCAGGEDKNEI